MIKAAIVGLGWWGRTLVESVQEAGGAASGLMRFTAGTTRTRTPDIEAFSAQHGIAFAADYEALLADPNIDAVVLATPPSGHLAQVTAAAAAGKHVFCEKPFTFSKREAEAAIAAVEKSGIALGIGYNRRFHPEMGKLRERLRNGELGTLMHIDCIMTVPNALMMKPSAWRAQKGEAPCGGLAPLGVHAIDGLIDLAGEIDTVYCQSFRRAVALDMDDTTSVLFRMKGGASGYLGTMMATAPMFTFQVFGSKGWLRMEGMTMVAGASSQERRTALFGTCTFQPVQGPPQIWQADRVDVTRACLEGFATAAAGGAPFPITLAEIVHGASATEAVVRSAASGQVEKVG